LLLVAVSVLLGVALAGPLVAGALSPFSPLPVPNPVVFTPVLGLLIYWWTDGIEEVLAVLVGTTVVGTLVVVGFLSIPAFVLDASVAGRGAVYQSSIFNAFIKIVFALPFVAITVVAASLLDSELGVLERYHPRATPTRRLVALTVGLALVALVVAGGLGANYASVADQSTAQVEVVGVDTTGEAIDVEVRVPNRLRTEMYVRSVVVDVTLNGSTPNRGVSLTRAWIDEGSSRTFVVTVDEISPSDYRDAESVRITGIVRIEAFRSYETGLRLEPWTRGPA
jgi:hypothetical protein